MIKLRLFTNPLDRKSLVEYELEPNSRIIDFLQTNYPEGFNGTLRVFVGRDELLLEDLDYEVQELDTITLLVMPAGGVEIATALISAAVSIAVGVVINLLFPPPKMNDSGGEESVVYSLGPTKNEARLGNPVPSVYGTCTWAPDFASVPYVFFSGIDQGNDMFVDELLCLGHGKYDIEEVYIGDTPVSQMEKGVVFYYNTAVGGHYRTMGAFAEIINRKLANTRYPYPFHENIFTSPEVQDFEFNDLYSTPEDSGGSFGSEAVAIGAQEDPETGELYSAQFKDVASSLKVGPGDNMSITGTTSNNGDFLVVTVIVNPKDDTLKTLYVRQNTGDQVVVDEDPLGGSYTLNSIQKNMTAGPYNAQKPGQKVTEVFCDFLFPQGLYRISGSGNARKRSIVMDISYQEVDTDTGVPIGSPTLSLSTRSPAACATQYATLCPAVPCHWGPTL